MAKYTIRVKEILENYYYMKVNNRSNEIISFDTREIVEGSTWNNPFNTNYSNPFERDKTPSVDTLIDETWRDLFNFTYIPLKETPTGELEKKIIKYYYMREIGFETIERFKLALNETLNRIMPYYNDLLESIKLNGDNPLENYNLIDHSNRDTKTDNDTSSTSNIQSNSEGKTLFEDTPSNELAPMTNYATNVTKSNNESNNQETQKGSSDTSVNDVYDRNAHGLMGYSKQDMIARYRENLINIEELIIMELRDLFMLIY